VRLSIGALCFLALGSWTIAQAQTVNSFVISHNGWSYSETNLIGGRTSSSAGFADFGHQGGPDHFYQNWWWYRGQVGGIRDTREYALSNQTSGAASGNAAQLTYLEPVAGRPDALLVTLNYTLIGTSPTQATLRIDWTATNMTGETLHLGLFPYADADVQGTAGNDTGLLLASGGSSGRMRASEGPVSVDIVHSGIQGMSVNHWEISPFPDTRNKLTDTDVDVLSDTGSPFGPGDFSSAFQISGPLDANESAYGSMFKIIVPEPGSLVAFGSGLALLASLRRRRS
jgi:hypothetical protein